MLATNLLVATALALTRPLAPARPPHAVRPALSRAAARPRAVRCCHAPSEDDISADEADLNMLQTRLHAAVASEDYALAARLRDAIASASGTSGAAEAPWDRLGVPDWLCDRLGRLDLCLPTRVQLHALRALESGDDAAICAPTGSGKTLAYLLPVLSRLSDDLLSEDLATYLASALDGGRPRLRAKQAAARAASSGGMDELETTVPTPTVLIVVPTRELGVQASLLAYRLLGGGTTNPTLQPYTLARYQPGQRANMFSYKGPRHVKVAGLWDEQALFAAAYQDLLKGVHIIVGTPQYLARVGVGGNLRLANVRAVVIDEADACLSDPESATTMDALLRRMGEARASAGVEPPQTMLVGASLSPSLVRRAREQGWVREPTLVSERGWVEAGCQLETVPLDLDQQRVPAGSSHEYVVCDPAEAVATLCRLLRDRFERAAPGGEPPRVVVFAPSPEEAVELAAKLQGALFGTLSGDAAAGLWGLSVLLPSSEARLDGRLSDDDTLTCLESSLRVMEQFSANQTSVLVTTAAATRGLDFPQVTDVLNLGIVGSAADYVHRAGRVGRIGQRSRGSVISVLQPAEVNELLQLGETLHFEPMQRDAPAPTALSEEMDQEAAVQALADRFHLY